MDWPKINFPSGKDVGIGIVGELLLPGSGIAITAASNQNPGFFEGLGNSFSNLFGGGGGGGGSGRTGTGGMMPGDNKNLYIIAGVILLIVVIAVIVIKNKNKK